jgi:hypothetical protein
MLKIEEFDEVLRIGSLKSNEGGRENHFSWGVRDGKPVVHQWQRNHGLSADDCSLILLRRVADQLGHAYTLELTKPHPRLSALATAIRGVIAAHNDRDPAFETKE